MKKEILFVILDNYADWESSYLSSTIKEFNNGEYDIKTISIVTEPIKTIGGFTTIPDYGIENMPKNYTALFLIGGYSWKESNAQKLVPIIKSAKESGKLIGAICAASEFMGANGFLNDVSHTSNGVESIEEWENNLYLNQINYKEKQAVFDNNIITANGSATLEFAKESLKALKIAPDSEIDGWYDFNKIGFYKK